MCNGGFMSEKSIKHLEVLAKVREKKISQKDAAKILKSRVLELVTCEKYEGLGPSFMNEKLSELHSVTISTEAVRQLMIEVLRKNWGSIEEVRNTSIIILTQKNG